MIKEALEYIVGLGEGKEKIKTVKLPDGTEQVYSTERLERLSAYIPRAEAVHMNTLTSLVDYIKGNIDTMADRMIVQIKNPGEVLLFSRLDKDRKREYLVKCTALIPEFRYEIFINHEEFCINVQAKFLNDPETDKDLILRFAGTVENGSVAEYGDTGVTQKATVKVGIASKSDAVVPNPVRLRPYRTFMEVEQPVSEFIFRIKDVNGVFCALFEADGGAWKNEAMKNIKAYLDAELADYKEQFTVIS
ncbi:MAG: hypothetical protein NC123_18270 [Butyrivibrio sp.]|nr:hypothetical protein [Acetatifactor muris]MCM1561458.1 hypothetical protein [Butyrivibrio sp.]